MDLIDEVSYTDYEVEEEISKAYRDVFNGSDESRKVLKDILRICGWGYGAQDEQTAREVFIRNQIVHHIKKMLNGKQVQQQEIEDE